MGCGASAQPAPRIHKSLAETTEPPPPYPETALEVIKPSRQGRTIMVIFGPPGAGKGTHAPKIVARLGTPHLSPADMLRDAMAAETPAGLEATQLRARRVSVTDGLMVRIIKDRIQHPDCKLGFILDEFPRNIEQARQLDSLLAETGEKLSLVVSLVVPLEVLTERICGRWIHRPSGRTYHATFKPPLSLEEGAVPSSDTMLDDLTGEPLVQRSDDTEAILKQRLQSYHGETAAILNHYEPAAVVRSVDANRKPELVWNEIEDVIQAFALPRRIVILFGPPGSGKSTNGPKIGASLAIPHLSTGVLLRAAVAAKTPVGLEAEPLMEKGELVADDIVIKLIKDRTREPDCRGGFILCGFPRTVPQAMKLDELLARTEEQVDLVVALEVPSALLQERVCGRWTHETSGRSYHVKFAPPKSFRKGSSPSSETMLDDETGEPLMQRNDDTEEALKRRLETYYAETVPILKHYEVRQIVQRTDSSTPPGEVWNAIEPVLARPQ